MPLVAHLIREQGVCNADVMHLQWFSQMCWKCACVSTELASTGWGIMCQKVCYRTQSHTEARVREAVSGLPVLQQQQYLGPQWL